MAKQTIGIGTSANDGTGDALRVAFDKTNDNFNEIYADDFVTTARIADDAITEAHLDATNAPTDNYVLSYDSATSGFTWVQQFDGDITGIVAGGGLTGDATSGDATLAVGAGTGITVNADDIQIADGGVDTLQLAADAVDGTKIADDSIDSDHYVDGSIDTANIADDQITHAKLEGRYTEDVSITTYTGTVSFDCSNGSVFKLGGDLTGTYTIDLTSYKKGQIITIYPLKGNQTLNLDAQGSSTNTFNKIGGVDYEDDGTSNNILQIECVDDSSTDPVFFYSLSTYASDSSDI